MTPTACRATRVTVRVVAKTTTSGSAKRGPYDDREALQRQSVADGECHEGHSWTKEFAECLCVQEFRSERGPRHRPPQNDPGHPEPRHAASKERDRSRARSSAEEDSAHEGPELEQPLKLVHCGTQRIPSTGPIPRIEHPELVADRDLQEGATGITWASDAGIASAAAECSAEDERDRNGSQSTDAPVVQRDDRPEAPTEDDGGAALVPAPRA